MIKVEINKQEYNLPEGWEDVNLRKFAAITEFLTGRDYVDSSKSELRKSVDLLGLLMDCDPDIIFTLSKTAYMELSSKITWILNEPKGAIKKFFTINGVTYMSPVDLDQLSVGEVVSMETVIANDPKDIAGILSIIIRPRIGVYNEEKQEEEWEQEPFDIKNYSYRKELFNENLKVSDIMSLSNFFLSGGNLSSSIMKISSEKEEK